VHVRHVGVRPRDEVTVTRHDQKLPGSSGIVCPSEHFQEVLSRRRGGSISRLRTLVSPLVAARNSPGVLA
jgi:hypothetical protein